MVASTDWVGVLTGVAAVISALGVVLVNVLATMNSKKAAAAHEALTQKVENVVAAVTTPPNEATLGQAVADIKTVVESAGENKGSA